MIFFGLSKNYYGVKSCINLFSTDFGICLTIMEGGSDLTYILYKYILSIFKYILLNHLVCGLVDMFRCSE